MISVKGREMKRGRPTKMVKTMERLYRENKCRECTVVMTRMNFAKILGKFTKVKIQYESSSPKAKQQKPTPLTSPNSNARLKSNENGMVLIHRNAYNQHPVKEVLGVNKSPKNNSHPKSRITNNILKENNRLKRPILKGDLKVYKKPLLGIKQYGIIFVDPTLNSNNNSDCKNNITLEDLLPVIRKDILPSEHWHIDYFPKNEEPKDDKVYDRIAAELQDLMYNEKKSPPKADLKPEALENNVDDFPSIMDILNDNSNNKPIDQNSSIELRSNLESSDVEAMLLGKSNDNNNKNLNLIQADLVNSEMNKLIDDVEQFNPGATNLSQEVNTIVDDLDNPHSPSILDQTLQKGIEEHIPSTGNEPVTDEKMITDSETEEKIITDSENSKTEPETNNDKESVPNTNGDITNTSKTNIKQIDENDTSLTKINNNVTHVVFSISTEGQSYKSVLCPKNLRYSIELSGKSVELIGAPKFISSIEDLKVLLQIVNDSDLGNLYVLHS